MNRVSSADNLKTRVQQNETIRSHDQFHVDGLCVYFFVLVLLFYIFFVFYNAFCCKHSRVTCA